MTSLYNNIIDLTGFSKYKRELNNSSYCIQIFQYRHNKLIISFLNRKDKIELFYRNYEYQTLKPLKFSNNEELLKLYTKLYNEMIQDKEKSLQTLNKEFYYNFNKFVVYMKYIFNNYIIQL